MDHADEHPGFIHLHPLKGGAAQWLHMSVNNVETAEFLMNDALLNGQIVEALLEEDTRSRIRVTEAGIMVLLKSTLSPDVDMPTPDDMVTMRVWIDKDRVISTQERDADPIRIISDSLHDGNGPDTPTAFLTALLDHHFKGLGVIVEEIEDDARDLDELILSGDLDEMCSLLAGTQKKVASLIRHLSPQRAVLERLLRTDHPLLDEDAKGQIDGHLNHLLRHLEALSAVRERTDILHSQHERILDRDQNKTAHLFSVIATIFLPLGFITGMWGVNLNGIPMSEHPNGFLLLTAGSIVIMALLMLLFKFRRWF